MFDLYFGIPCEGPRVLIGIFGVGRKSNGFIQTHKTKKREENDQRMGIMNEDERKKEKYIEEVVVLRQE
jgi:hypothetical protein